MHIFSHIPSSFCVDLRGNIGTSDSVETSGTEINVCVPSCSDLDTCGSEELVNALEDERRNDVAVKTLI